MAIGSSPIGSTPSGGGLVTAVVEVRTSLVGALVAAEAVAPEMYVPLSGAFAIVNFPTPFVYGSGVGAAIAATFLAGEIQASYAGVMVVGRGRIDNPKVRAWTFTLDGHDFYVLRLGDNATLVYDLYSQQWMDWSSEDLTFWRPNTGVNWLGGQVFASAYGSDVVVGDDVHGLIYFLDPEQPFDQTPLDYVEDQEQYFQRIVQGQVPLRGREVLPCYAAWITTDMGDPAYEGAFVTLEISDDAGQTYSSAGGVVVTSGANTPELAWYSLGQIAAPGRLFKIIDDGAVHRIDGLEMEDPNGG